MSGGRCQHCSGKFSQGFDSASRSCSLCRSLNRIYDTIVGPLPAELGPQVSSALVCLESQLSDWLELHHVHTSGPSDCQTAPPAWRPTLSRGHDAPEAAAKVKPSPVQQRSQRERKKRPKEESDEVSVSPDRGRTSRSCSASSLGSRTPQSEREDYSPHHARDRQGPTVGEDYPHRERRHWGANTGRKKRERNARRKEQGKGKPGRKG